MDYKNGKIYKITDNAYTKIYIGSTTQPLSKRFSNHKLQYQLYKDEKIKIKTTSFDLFEEFGVENCKIELIENYECNSKEELLKKEGEHIKNNNCVNKLIAGRTKKEYREDNKNKIKEYLKTNKEKLKAYHQAYREANKDKIKAYKKAYKEANKEKIKEQNKAYREANKDKIKEQMKTYYQAKKNKI